MIISRFERSSVRGFIHQPAVSASAGLVITHGAGSNCEAPLLIAFANSFCKAGVLVLRCDLPFRQKRRFGPPASATAAEDRSGLREAVALVREIVPGPIILGGHSYGGRQASILAASEQDLVDGLLLFSYPLHPPARPTQLRTTHWPSLRTPSFFVHGTKDPFGSVDEVRSALPLITAPTTLVTIGGAGHELQHGRFDIDNIVLAPFRAFMIAAGNRADN